MFQPPWCIWPQIWGRRGQETGESFCEEEGGGFGGVRVWVCCWEVNRRFPPYREGMIRRERAGEGNRYREGQGGRYESPCSRSCRSSSSTCRSSSGSDSRIIPPLIRSLFNPRSKYAPVPYFWEVTSSYKSITFLPEPHCTGNKWPTF